MVIDYITKIKQLFRLHVICTESSHYIEKVPENISQNIKKWQTWAWRGRHSIIFCNFYLICIAF